MATSVGQVFQSAESIGVITNTGVNTYELAVSVITFGGLQYTTDIAKTLDLSVLGAGGIDTGSLAKDSTYNVFAVLDNGDVALVASLGASPTGFLTYVDLGEVITIDSANTAILNPETPSNAKNLIINGGFDFWQRGTSSLGVFQTYVADRFRYFSSTAQTVDYQRLTDTPVELTNTVSYCAELSKATAATIGATTRNSFQTGLEGSFLKTTIGKDITLSFYVKCNRPRVQTIRFHNGLSNRTFVKEYTIDQADTWERKSITISIEDVAWNIDNTSFGFIEFITGAGATLHGVEGWQAGDFTGTANQESVFGDGTNNYIRFTGIMFHEGDKVQDFQTAGENHAEEGELCDRYYNSIQALGFSDGSNVGVRSIVGQYNTVMRVSPTVSGTFVHINGGGGNFSITSMARPEPTRGVTGSGNSGGGVSGTFRYRATIISDAEL